jgi:hypothetical protein
MSFLKFKTQIGFITLEILLALMILTTALSATTLLSFSNVMVATDIKSAREGRRIGERSLAVAKARLLADFKQDVSTTTTDTAGYTSSVSIESVEYFSKLLTARVTWSGGYMREQSVTLRELVTDYQNTAAGDTCDPSVTGDWTKPVTANAITDFATLVGNSVGMYPITDIDVYRGRLYVVANNTSNNQDTFFMFDVSDIKNPKLISKLDNDLVNNTGIKGISVSGTRYETFAYVASASSFSKGQLQVIDASSSPPKVVATYKIPNSIVSGSSTQGSGNSIFFKDGYVYLGLTKTVSGPEFNIIDVHNPYAPVWVGGYSVGNSINAIYIFGGNAFLATPNNQELIVLDIRNPTHPTYLGGFDAPDNLGSGKSLYLVGQKLYLGRTATGSHPELYVVDIADSSQIPSTPLGSIEINSSVNGLIARGSLLYLITTSGQLELYGMENVTNSAAKIGSVLLPDKGSGVTLDCEGNVVFAASVPTSGPNTGKGSISIITTNLTK